MFKLLTSRPRLGFSLTPQAQVHNAPGSVGAHATNIWSVGLLMEEGVPAEPPPQLLLRRAAC